MSSPTPSKKLKLPPWLPRAISVSVALAMFISIGELLKFHADDPMIGQQLFTGAKWAGITCAVVAGPVTGGVANTCKERVLGTAAGGLTGFAVYWLNQNLDAVGHGDRPVSPERTAIVMGLIAGAIGWIGVWGGALLKLTYSAKLFMTAFLLVFSGASNEEQAEMIMLTRICGICVGVCVTLLFAVTILPTTAHDNMIAGVQAALTGLLELDEVSWVHIRGRLCPPSASAQVAAAAAAAAAADAAADASNFHVTTADEANEAAIKNAVRAKEQDELAAEKSMVKVYNAIEKINLALPLANNEIYVGHVFGYPFYLPRAFAWCVGGSKWRPVPDEEVEEVCRAVRNVARLQMAIHNIFDDGLDQSMTEIVKERYPEVLMPLLVQGTHDCIQDCKSVFPEGQGVPAANWQQLNLAVESLLRISDYQRRRIAKHFQRYKAQAALYRLYCAPMRQSAPAGPAAAPLNASDPGSLANRVIATLSSRARARRNASGRASLGGLASGTSDARSLLRDSQRRTFAVGSTTDASEPVLPSMSEAASAPPAPWSSMPLPSSSPPTHTMPPAAAATAPDANALPPAASNPLTGAKSPSMHSIPEVSEGPSQRPAAGSAAQLSLGSSASLSDEPHSVFVGERKSSRHWQVPRSLVTRNDAHDALADLPEGLYIQRCSTAGSSPTWLNTSALVNCVSASRRESHDARPAGHDAGHDAAVANGSTLSASAPGAAPDTNGHDDEDAVQTQVQNGVALASEGSNATIPNGAPSPGSPLRKVHASASGIELPGEEVAKQHPNHGPCGHKRHGHSRSLSGSSSSPPPRAAGPNEPRPDLRMVIPRVDTQKMKMFPDTTEGHISEVRWFTFQFHMEELTEALEDLQDSIHALLHKLPSNPYYLAPSPQAQDSSDESMEPLLPR